MAALDYRQNARRGHGDEPGRRKLGIANRMLNGHVARVGMATNSTSQLPR